MLAGSLNIVSIGIIFFPQNLKHLILPLVILIVHHGLLQSIYVVYMFKNLLFPEVTEEISQMEVPRILALDDDDDVTPGDIELMQSPGDSPSGTTHTTASPTSSNRPFPVPHGNDGQQLQELEASQQPGSPDSGSMVGMSEIDDNSSPQMPRSRWRRSSKM